VWHHLLSGDPPFLRDEVIFSLGASAEFIKTPTKHAGESAPKNEAIFCGQGGITRLFSCLRR
jgi:hypothetical protein